MEKIPTLFQRDPEDMRSVLPEVTPGCEWVLAGEGVATRKYDGTCMMFDGQHWWARREVKPGKQPPANYQAISTDETTGKTVGWEPIEQSAFAKFVAEALDLTFDHGRPDLVGTYELCGPKINGNPERLDEHHLIPHAAADDVTALLGGANDYAELRYTLLSPAFDCIEGIVWHHPDGRMAKLKVRDFSKVVEHA